MNLGPQALPAMDTYARRFPYFDCFLFLEQPADGRRCAPYRDELAASHRAAMKNWRVWSFRGWQLLRYLDSRSL